MAETNIGKASLRLVGFELSLPALALGVFFFACSLTPSLIPRDAVVQGALGGTVMALGYLVGRIIGLIWRAADMPRAGKIWARTLALTLLAAALLLAGWNTAQTLTWQNDLRLKMGIEEADGVHLITLVGATVTVFFVLFLIGALIAAFFHTIRARLYRIIPPRRANVLSVVLVALALFFVTRDGLLDRVLTGLDEGYTAAQQLFDDAPPPPDNSRMTGSAASLVDWSAMGEPGRNFVTQGPDANAISSFTGRPALDPIRVYVGRANGETPQERADLALAELIRQNAFEREVLVMASPTGTGWLDPGSHDPLEYMHNGDIATVAAQYSYMQSHMALIFETRTGLDQADALFSTVHSYWKTLPPDERPRLYIHGLSLGAWSSMYATSLFRLVDQPIHGAFWAGPPFSSNFWNELQNQRNEGTPWVLPTVGDGSLVRYASRYADATQGAAPWGNMRIAFLQYSSDPIVFYDPRSIWRAPPWMNDPPAPDASQHRQFIPIVTHFQLALDMALSFGSPPGHGHAYFAQDYIAPWVEVTAPADWTAEDTERLKQHCDLGFQQGCRNG